MSGLTQLPTKYLQSPFRIHSLERATVPQLLVRIYFSAITDTVICISHVTDIVNQDAERTNTNIYGGCVASPNTAILTPSSKTGLVIIPNPATDRVFVHITGQGSVINDFTISDMKGRIYHIESKKVRDDWYEIETGDLPPGVYFAGVKSAAGFSVVRFIKL